jgi:hypothetical protein
MNLQDILTPTLALPPQGGGKALQPRRRVAVGYPRNTRETVTSRLTSGNRLADCLFPAPQPKLSLK